MNIQRNDIWLVSLDLTIGAEIRKTRPVVVVSADALGLLPIKLVAPCYVVDRPGNRRGY
ncbi:MAG: hypothetical protein MAG431_00653 [Chloroflexi bacterium]|nr:hypothetical protein [Chloroflexota bacterium]